MSMVQKKSEKCFGVDHLDHQVDVRKPINPIFKLVLCSLVKHSQVFIQLFFEETN